MPIHTNISYSFSKTKIIKEDTSYKRVAAYCRVSTDDPNQTSSYELQKNHYEEFIKEHPGWELVDIYADEGISGTSLAHREEFARMIEDCENGKIDLIITKSISRFARNTVDSISTVRKLAQRHCGDVLARKTYTPSYLNHKAKKNVDERTKYRQRDHHEAIVSREVFNAANHLQASRAYTKKNRPLPLLSVIDNGILSGYVPIDKDWTGFSVEEYQAASESIKKKQEITETGQKNTRILSNSV